MLLTYVLNMYYISNRAEVCTQCYMGGVSLHEWMFMYPKALLHEEDVLC